MTQKKLSTSAPAYTAELKQILSAGRSVGQRDHIIHEIGFSEDRLEAAVYLLYHSSPSEVFQIAWALGAYPEKYPGLILPWLSELLRRSEFPDTSDAVKRNVTRILSIVEIPEELHEQVLDLSFRYFSDPLESIAVRAFCVKILGKLSNIYPEITGELSELLRLELEKDPPPAIKSKAHKVLSQLTKRLKA